MDAQKRLEDAVRRQTSPLLGPAALAHSQELKDGLPPVRRYVGPRAWYQALETAVPPAGVP